MPWIIKDLSTGLFAQECLLTKHMYLKKKTKFGDKDSAMRFYIPDLITVGLKKHQDWVSVES